MDRRQFLGGIGTAGTVAICGCSSASPEPMSLRPPTVENPDEGVYFYNFASDGDPVGNVDVEIAPRATPSERAKLGLSIGPQTGWQNTMVQFALRAEADSTPDEPARFLLEVADGASYPVSFRVTDHGYRVLKLEGLVEADLGNATIPLQLEVVPRTAVESLSLRSTIRWRSPDGALMEGSFTDTLSMPITR